ncbi:uncharacterized protein LOC129585114 isoform X2 [Paramacrobiotus metropolitanus]|uniref:uncharacterized protein LOC129585114 isoform X2 n=1 Tax=Paramacrobiotus metropolitanus TaxID=2943436 RepID=UPI002445EE17|nr:uncharacterized protein LOC129585114 isoform X2 [Paramacrobiotus metropolitanus]
MQSSSDYSVLLSFLLLASSVRSCFWTSCTMLDVKTCSVVRTFPMPAYSFSPMLPQLHFSSYVDYSFNYGMPFCFRVCSGCVSLCSWQNYSKVIDLFQLSAAQTAYDDTFVFRHPGTSTQSPVYAPVETPATLPDHADLDKALDLSYSAPISLPSVAEPTEGFLNTIHYVSTATIHLDVQAPTTSKYDNTSVFAGLGSCLQDASTNTATVDAAADLGAAENGSAGGAVDILAAADEANVGLASPALTDSSGKSPALTESSGKSPALTESSGKNSPSFSQRSSTADSGEYQDASDVTFSKSGLPDADAGTVGEIINKVLATAMLPLHKKERHRHFQSSMRTLFTRDKASRDRNRCRHDSATGSECSWETASDSTAGLSDASEKGFSISFNPLLPAPPTSIQEVPTTKSVIAEMEKLQLGGDAHLFSNSDRNFSGLSRQERYFSAKKPEVSSSNSGQTAALSFRDFYPPPKSAINLQLYQIRERIFNNDVQVFSIAPEISAEKNKPVYTELEPQIL